MSKIRAITVEQFDNEYGVGKECIMCEFCGERTAQMTFSHDGYLGLTDVGNHVYLFCGLCFFANIKYFLEFINARI